MENFAVTSLRSRRWFPFVVIAVVVAIALVVAGWHRGGGSSAASPTVVAAAAGSGSCDDSGYSLVSRSTGDQEEIYDCAFGTFPLREKCVTYADGVANDSTAATRIAFSTALGTSKPSCLSG